MENWSKIIKYFALLMVPFISIDACPRCCSCYYEYPVYAWDYPTYAYYPASVIYYYPTQSLPQKSKDEKPVQNVISDVKERDIPSFTLVNLTPNAKVGEKINIKISNPTLNPEAVYWQTDDSNWILGGMELTLEASKAGNVHINAKISYGNGKFSLPQSISIYIPEDISETISITVDEPKAEEPKISEEAKIEEVKVLPTNNEFFNNLEKAISSLEIKLETGVIEWESNSLWGLYYGTFANVTPINPEIFQKLIKVDHVNIKGEFKTSLGVMQFDIKDNIVTGVLENEGVYFLSGKLCENLCLGAWIGPSEDDSFNSGAFQLAFNEDFSSFTAVWNRLGDTHFDNMFTGEKVK